MPKKKKQLKNRQSAALPGFPCKNEFHTKEEVDGYFSGEKIQCLLCGGWFDRISSDHLESIHGATPDEYRERYGIPGTRELTGKGGSQSPGGTTKKRSVRGSDAGHGRGGKWRTEDYERILERMREQKRALREVCGGKDVPGYASWKKFVKTHPDIAEKARQIHHTLPYAVQLRIKDVSPDFLADCRSMNAKGWGLEKIANALGVSMGPVRRVLLEAQGKKGGSDQALETRATKWRRKDFEAILERMEMQKRTLVNVCKDPDLPSRGAWNYFIKTRPELAKEALRIHYDLPYALQLKSHKITPRFSEDCERLRDQGVSQRKIATSLEVSITAVRRVFQDDDETADHGEQTAEKPLAPEPEMLRLYVKDHRGKWRLEDFEAILDRMLAQQRALNDVCGDPDLPSESSWNNFLKKHPEFAMIARHIHFSLPYSAQIGAREVSPQFSIDCERQYALGASIKKIADELGVSTKHVEQVLQGPRKEEGNTNRKRR